MTLNPSCFQRLRARGQPSQPSLTVRRLLPGLLVAAVLALTGCAGQPVGGDGDAAAPGSGGATTRPLGTGDGSPLDDPSSPVYRKIVYFDYDTAAVPAEYAPLLRAHARYLAQTPGASVTLEGHADERGTRDYNLALAERRSEAVKSFLMAEGVPAAKLRTLSYGEERPADPGHHYQAWSQNRRVELVY
ncbi:peptidoglycan-associated lipoprotein Pal [Thiohalocapsa marina]|uniref:peptidoglycan-associated lipoprotein Pal n=1 Tax=Thiohalocapsa marina TaxID=424902 RepID=UPI001FE733F5|nr:peptidoglycan-associated lipoprotein Pal [Thiohalocapsa marina]